MTTRKKSPAAAENRDEDISPGQMLNLPEYDLLPFKNPSRRYLILSPQRTGSNYLCRRLCNVKGRFGLPSEYLHPKALKMLSSRLLADKEQVGRLRAETFMRGLERARTTGDGWFGIKVQPMQMLALVGKKNEDILRFVAGFDRLVLITRRDKLGQAVSGAIAFVTGKWFNDGAEPALDDARMESLFPAIAQNLARYIEEERMILNIGRVVAKPLLRIGYEEIEADSQGAFMNLVEFLSGDASPVLDEEETAQVPEKPPGAFARGVREAFIRYIEGSGV